MASGKLSPRQKMINMMYLVLTALLALQTSSEILEAFALIRESLHESEIHAETKNNDLRSAIEAKIKEEQEQGIQKNQYLLNVLSEANNETNKVISFINTELIPTLETIGQKDPTTGKIVNDKETEKNFQFWMGSGNQVESNGGRGAGKGKDLRDLLDGYVTWANEFISKNKLDSTLKFESITKDVNEGEGGTVKRTWEYHIFHGKPVIADLAMMEKFKMDVQNIESTILQLIKGKLGEVKFKIDSLIAQEAPISQVVAAGMPYESKIFVTMASKDVKPEYVGATTDASGMFGIYKTTANGNVIPNGKNEGEQSYSVLIKVPKTDGSIQELKVSGKFTVRRPELVVTSASVQILYKDCGNKINADVPALGDLYNPDFTKSTGGTVIPSTQNKKEVTLVPTGSAFKLIVFSNTNGQSVKVGERDYKVIAPPTPQIEIVDMKGSQISLTTPIPKNSTIIIKVKPNADFKSALPKDARYSCNSVKVMVQDGLGPVKTVENIPCSGKNLESGVQISLASAMKPYPPGTKVFLEIDVVNRINFQNKQVKENLNIYQRTFPLTTK